MKTCKITLFSGRSVPCSREAAELALVIDRLEKYPALMKTILPAIETVKRGLDGVDAFEKAYGPERAKEMVAKYCPQ